MKLVYRFKTQLRRTYRDTTAANRQGIPHSPVNLLSQTVNKSDMDICQNWSLQLLYSVNVILPIKARLLLAGRIFINYPPPRNKTYNPLPLNIKLLFTR
jgi:hypothetical protein